MQNLYIIAGCNGAGKTTASFTLLPKILNCNEFVNADEIARGISPFNAESVSVEAGRIMIQRIDGLLNEKKSFAVETTLSSRSYVKKIKGAITQGYNVSLIFFWLPSEQQAIERVKSRVKEGGHNIPTYVVRRRYYAGLKNLFELYIPLCDHWLVFDNSTQHPHIIAEGHHVETSYIYDDDTWGQIQKLSNHGKIT
ncbi:MAG: zeta toxin family protein [Flavobacteriales bacterium]|nr:zeta toxin family protein [Flavobacteriales bacterium]